MAQIVARMIEPSLKCFFTHHLVNYRSVKMGSAHVRPISATSKLLANRLFAESHEWLEINDDKTVGTVGISNYAQDALGDVVYVQLPQVGSVVKKNEEIGALESVKAVSELMSPVSGEVIEKNDSVESKPALINTSPYKDGWLFKIKMNNSSEIDTLMDEKIYEEFLKKDH